MDRRKIIRSVLFFVIGAGIFWYVYRDLQFREIADQLHLLKAEWIALSVTFNLLSQYIRAVRWRSLIIPMNYKPGTTNLFLAVLIMSVTNLVVPRAGEFARLGAVNRTEKIPFTRLLGTALVERMTDLLILILIALALFIWQFDNFLSMVNLSGISFRGINTSRMLILIGAMVLVTLVVIFIFRKVGLKKKIRDRLRRARQELVEGIRTISQVRSKGWYVFQSLLIFILYFAMMFVMVFAYPPVNQLTFAQVAFTFGFSTLAFLVPVQAGIGAWHFLVIQSLSMFGIAEPTGKVFALVTHSFTMMIYLVIGSIALIVLPLVYKSE